MYRLVMGTFVFLITLQAFADSNLWELLQTDQHRYSIGSCRNFIQYNNKKSLYSPELQKLLVKLKQTKMGEYFFHYSSSYHVAETLLKGSIADRAAAQEAILSANGYRSIMEFQMTYSGALSNVAGVGFYISANPFSSSSYGPYQFVFKLSPEARYLDYVEHYSEVLRLLYEKKRQLSYLDYCDNDLAFSLFMDVNEVDVVLYDKGSQWHVVFNEDIFVESKVNYIDSTNSSLIMSKMFNNGDLSALLESATEFGLEQGSYGVTLNQILGTQGDSIQSLLQLLQEKGKLTPGIKLAIIQRLASLSGAEFWQAMDEVKGHKDFSPDLFFGFSLARASDEYLDLITEKLKAQPKKAKLWNEHLLTNLDILYRKKLLTLGFILSKTPQELDHKAFLQQFKRSDYPANQRLELIDYSIAQHAEFKQWEEADRQAALRLYFQLSSPQAYPELIAKLHKAKHELRPVYDFALTHSREFGNNAADFILSYIHYLKDPELLSVDVIDFIVGHRPTTLPGFYIFMKGNKVFQEKLDSLQARLLSAFPVTGIKDLLASGQAAKLDKSEAKLLLMRLLLQSDSGEVLPQLVREFSLAPKELSQALVEAAPNMPRASGNLKTLLEMIAQDQATLDEFLKLDNKQGISVLMGVEALGPELMDIIQTRKAHFYQQPLGLPAMSYDLSRRFFQPLEFANFFPNYSGEEQYAVWKRASNYHGVRDLLLDIKFDANLVSMTLNELFGRYDRYEHLNLMNNASWVRELSLDQFESMANSLNRSFYDYDLGKLISSDALTSEKALIFLLSFRHSRGTSNLDSLKSKIDIAQLSSQQKTEMVKLFIRQLGRLDTAVKDAAWKGLFPSGLDELSAKELIANSYDWLPAIGKLELMRFYAASAERINEALLIYSHPYKSFFSLAFQLDDKEIATNLLSFIEGNYPVQADYASDFIGYYGQDMRTQELLEKHTRDFICKKVNDFNAFKTLIKNAHHKDRKKALKRRRKKICKPFLWF